MQEIIFNCEQRLHLEEEASFHPDHRCRRHCRRRRHRRHRRCRRRRRRRRRLRRYFDSL